jgi:hypothetical protein
MPERAVAHPPPGRKLPGAMADVWRAKLPPDVNPPFEVFLNGVPQEEGKDFTYHGGDLLFERPLAKEGRLGFWRWFLGAWGIGTYRKNDTVDVRYTTPDGRPMVAHGLDIVPPDEPKD